MAAMLLRRSGAVCAPRPFAHLGQPLPNYNPLSQNRRQGRHIHTSVCNPTKAQTKGPIPLPADQIDFTKFAPVTLTPPRSFDSPLYSLKTGAQTGSHVTLDSSIFGALVRTDILHRVVVWKLACKRTGTARVKTRGEVVGNKQKMAPQKGRGMARVGTKRSPIRRGGGKAHGPRPRDFSFTLPKKVRRLGLRCALAAKFAQNKLIIVDDTDLDAHKTKPFKQTIEAAGWTNALIVDTPNVNVKLYLASRNIPNITLMPQQKANVYDILRHDYLILHRDTLPYFFDRVNGLLPRVQKKKGIAYRRMMAAQQSAQEAEIKAKAKDQEL